MVECLVLQQNNVEIVKTLGLLKPLDRHNLSSLGASLNGFFHKSTQVKMEECYYRVFC